MPATLTHVTGDATAPHGTGRRIVCHVVNDAGRWGAGFVLALARRWPKTQSTYRAWHHAGSAPDPIAGGHVAFGLGSTLTCVVEPGLAIAHLCAQHGVGRQGGRTPLRYDALAACLDQVAALAGRTGASVHCPRLGAGLAGGDWDRVEGLLRARVVAAGVGVTVYTPACR